MNNDLNQSNNIPHHSLPSPMLPNPTSATHHQQSAARPPNPPNTMGAPHHRRFTPQTPALLSHPDDNPGPWTRRSASWSRAEDERLAQLVQIEEANAPTTTPTKMWSRVATQLTGRTGKQCRERWLNQLKPGIRRGQWTEEEEMILHQAHAELGNKWVAIAQRLPGRTDNCVKNHWNSMLRKRQRREAAMRSAEQAGRGRNTVSRSANLAISGGFSAPEVSSDLARRATSIPDTRNVPQMPPTTNFYDLVHASNPGAFDTLSRGLIDSSQSLSSPITPQRNSKLQIANLVQPHRTRSAPIDAAVAPESFASAALSTHNTLGFDNRTPTPGDRAPPPTDPSGLAKLHPSMHQPPLHLPAPGFVFSDPSSHPLAAENNSLSNLNPVGMMNPFARKDESHVQSTPYGTGAPYLPNSISPVTTPVAGIGPTYTPLDQRMWNTSPFAMNEQPRSHLQRRTSDSSELSTPTVDRRATMRGSVSRNGHTSNKISDGKLGTVKSITKTPVRRGGSTGTSLNALATAASSVPPSPLTPESRFSSTSRSTSPLPNTCEGEGGVSGGAEHINGRNE